MQQIFATVWYSTNSEPRLRVVTSYLLSLLWTTPSVQWKKRVTDFLHKMHNQRGNGLGWRSQIQTSGIRVPWTSYRSKLPHSVREFGKSFVTGDGINSSLRFEKLRSHVLELGVRRFDQQLLLGPLRLRDNAMGSGVLQKDDSYQFSVHLLVDIMLHMKGERRARKGVFLRDSLSHWLHKLLRGLALVVVGPVPGILAEIQSTSISERKNCQFENHRFRQGFMLYKCQCTSVPFLWKQGLSLRNGATINELEGFDHELTYSRALEVQWRDKTSGVREKNASKIMESRALEVGVVNY
ncbi:hypothetical protein EDD85DRAFT_971378 [Armillaria nabsnona]|nr:hypothetical protein EDD85DRAFT_971378 [Armillaria nabsnona]